MFKNKNKNRNESIKQKKIKQSKNRVADYLPWCDLYSNGTVLTKQGMLLASWYVNLPDTDTSEQAAEDVQEQIETWLHGQDTGACYWFDLIRQTEALNMPDYVLQSMENVSEEIERHREELFADPSRNNRNKWYFSCCVKAELTLEGIVAKEQDRCEQFYSDFESVLKNIGAEPNRLTGSALVSYLATTASSHIKKLQSPETLTGLSDFISTEPMEATTRPLVLGETYVQPLTVHAFPSTTFSSVFGGILYLQFPFRWSTRWVPLSNRDSQQLAKRKFASANAALKSPKTMIYENLSGEQTNNIERFASNDSAEVDEVMNDIAKGETLGYFTSTIILYADDMEILQKRVQFTLETIRSMQFDAVVEKSGCFGAWLGAMPGDCQNNLIKPIVTATNFSQIIPFSSKYYGSSENHYMKEICGMGFAHMVGKTLTNEPYFLNLNGPSDDVGHTFVVGSTGGGKSILLALLATQWMRYPQSRVILFDKDMSFGNLCRRSKGAIYTPASEDNNLKFMPLSRILDKPEKAVEWLECAIQATNTEITPKMSEDLFTLCSRWDESAPTLTRFLTRLKGLNPNNPAIPALKRILDDKILGDLFGAETDDFNENSFKRITMIEMGKLMNLGDIAVFPALQFLFDRLDELFEKRPQPTLLILDEAWKFISHKMFRTKIKEWLKTLRKKQVFVIFALQNIQDIDDAEEFLTSCHTKIFLPNSNLKNDGGELKQLYLDIGLNDDVIMMIALARRKRDYIICQPEGNATVNFCIDSYQLDRLKRDEPRLL